MAVSVRSRCVWIHKQMQVCFQQTGSVAVSVGSRCVWIHKQMNMFVVATAHHVFFPFCFLRSVTVFV